MSEKQCGGWMPAHKCRDCGEVGAPLGAWGPPYSSFHWASCCPHCGGSTKAIVGRIVSDRLWLPSRGFLCTSEPAHYEDCTKRWEEKPEEVKATATHGGEELVKLVYTILEAIDKLEKKLDKKGRKK